MFCIGQRSQWPKKSPSFFLYRSYCIKDVCICMNGLSYEETTTAEPNTSLTYLNRYFLVKYHFCHFTYVTLQLFFGIKMYNVLARNWFIDIFGQNISLKFGNFCHYIFKSTLDISKCRLIRLTQRRKSREYLLLFINTYRKSV